MFVISSFLLTAKNPDGPNTSLHLYMKEMPTLYTVLSGVIQGLMPPPLPKELTMLMGGEIYTNIYNQKQNMASAIRDILW